jgi:hypothetical protein
VEEMIMSNRLKILKRIIILKKFDDNDANLDEALFRDISGPANDAWIDGVWEDMVRRYKVDNVSKEQNDTDNDKVIRPQSEDEDWMHSLPGYKDEGEL